MSQTDFSKPGNDGVLPAGFVPWRWSVTYTVHPELLSPIKSGREYRITAGALLRVENAQDPRYADLYNRAQPPLRTAEPDDCDAPNTMWPCIPGLSRTDGSRMPTRTLRELS